MRASVWHSSVRRLAILGFAVVLLVTLLPVVPVAAAPRTWWVDDGGNNASAGTEAAPLRTITYAMTKAVSGDTIMVKPGTYDPPDEVFPINLKKGVHLLSSAGATRTFIDAKDTDRVVFILDATAGTELVGFTVRGGDAAGGSGIYIDYVLNSPAGWPRIAENIISGNGNDGSLGGGVFVNSSMGTGAPLLEYDVIEYNTGRVGAGVYITGCDVTIRDSRIKNNYAIEAGGGVLVGPGSGAVILRNDFVANRSLATGGGLQTTLSAGETAKVTDCLFTSNWSGGGAHGGAVYASGAGGTLAIDRCEFNANASGDHGGGVYTTVGTASITNSTFFKNYSEEAATCVGIAGGATTITNCTMWNNLPGFWAVERIAGTCTVKNCIVGGHSNLDLYGVTVSNSLIQDTDFSGDSVVEIAGVIHGDPRFGNVGAGEFQLLADSPCIDKGARTDPPDHDFLNQKRPQDGNGDGTALVDMGAFEHPAQIPDRYAGQNRYETACLIAEQNFESAHTVVIASGENFPDALSAAGLAGCYDGPLLLVKKDDVPSAVLDTLGDLDVREAVIVGGPAVVSSVVETQLQDEGLAVSRIYGDDRYKTSAAVARKIGDMSGDMIWAVFIARGDEFPDALAVSPVAYGSDYPILLVKPDMLPSSVAQVLKDYDVREGRVCGGTTAVSESVADQVEALIRQSQFKSFKRWAGADRYATAAAVAEGAVAVGYSRWYYVGIATGVNFPDALAGGAVAGTSQGVVLLTKPTILPGVVADALKENKNIVQRAEVFGGTAAVSDGVKASVADALGW